MNTPIRNTQSQRCVGLIGLIVLGTMAGASAQDFRSRDDVVNPGINPEDRRPRLFSPQIAVPNLTGPRWKLGVEGDDTAVGVRITEVYSPTPASRAGLEPGDIIVSCNGFQVGVVGGQLYDIADEFQRRADRRGNVLLLVQSSRNGQLVNRVVRLERALDVERPPRLEPLRGTVSYRERIALSPIATVEVRLTETRNGLPTAIIADRTISRPGRVPVPFILDYNPSDIDPNADYVVDAQIWEGTRLVWESRQPLLAISRGQVQPNLNVTVETVRSGRPLFQR